MTPSSTSQILARSKEQLRGRKKAEGAVQIKVEQQCVTAWFYNTYERCVAEMRVGKRQIRAVGQRAE